MNGQEIAPTGVTVDKVIAVFQGHVVRVGRLCSWSGLEILMAL